MRRFQRLIPAIGVIAVLGAAIAGCGGGNKGATTDTGSPDGSLLNVQIWPPPGTTFISRATRFTLEWTNDEPPPPTFTAALRRYSENCDDGSDSCTSTQKTVLTRQGDSYVWEVSRKDDFLLDRAGVYYLQLDSGSDEINAAYIVTSDDRAQSASSAAKEPAVQNAGPEGALRHLVVTR